jgi:predicted nucleotide-binding protein
VIEKLEKYGRTADYAVMILTGDDIMQGTESRRARQNVIQELGWFQGVLGRNRTAMLVQQGTEIASNIAGVIYLEFISNNVEMIFESLRKEFEEAGII